MGRPGRFGALEAETRPRLDGADGLRRRCCFLECTVTSCRRGRQPAIDDDSIS